MINKILNRILSSNITTFFPKTINRKLLRNFKIFFVPTKFRSLPRNYYPIFTNLKDQIDTFTKFQIQKKIIKTNSNNSLNILLGKLFKKNFFTFLDIGGDNIDFYLYLKNELNISKYYIFNFRQIISIFRILKKKYKLYTLYPINITYKIKQVDFVYFGSSIQYFKNYKKFLKIIFIKNPKYIFFSGTTFFMNQENKNVLVVKQTNILPHLVHLYFFNYKNFINLCEKYGYKLIKKNKNTTANVNYKNFYQDYSKIQYLDLLFKKK